MTYSNKVKAAQHIINAINALKDNEHIVVAYGKDYNNEPRRFRIKCHMFKSGTSYSIHKDEVWALNGMNISEISKTTARAYTYDMMGQRTTYSFPLYEMGLVAQPFVETAHDQKF